jgi:hypothetical protein
VNKAVLTANGGLVLRGDILTPELRGELVALDLEYGCIQALDVQQSPDVLQALDVLEHLAGRWDGLRHLATLPNPGGSMLIGLLNISHGKPLLLLLFMSRFEYQDPGLQPRGPAMHPSRQPGQGLVA